LAYIAISKDILLMEEAEHGSGIAAGTDDRKVFKRRQQGRGGKGIIQPDKECAKKRDLSRQRPCVTGLWRWLLLPFMKSPSLLISLTRKRAVH
jgi:hypothetical protein